MEICELARDGEVLKVKRKEPTEKSKVKTRLF